MFSRVPPTPEMALPEQEDIASSTVIEKSHENLSQEKKPKCISEDLWKKFKQLEKRTDEVTKHSTAKRIKHLQKTVTCKVHEEISTEDDKEILRKHDVKFGPSIQENSRKRKAQEIKPQAEQNKDECRTAWKEIKPFLKAYDHLKGTDPGKYAPKSGLEIKIDSAINEGDFEKAEQLSDKLAVREFGKKVAGAIDARNYHKVQEEEKQSAKAKRKKKLPWGFEHKHRWETKSNM